MFRLPKERQLFLTVCSHIRLARQVSLTYDTHNCTRSSGRCLHTTTPVNSQFNKFMESMAGVKPFKFEILMPNDATSKTKFDDVGGQYEAKEELKEIVDFLNNRKVYTDLGARIPSGALISGPPGNGKTLLAKAIAGESSVPFINTAGPQFIEKIGGLGPKRVRQLFKKCRELAPCILFIDEIDAIAKKRDDAARVELGSTESNSLINQILVEMDGINARDEIFVIGATNRDDVLDPAVTRPGRLDRKIYIDNPTEQEREEIFAIHIANLKIDESIKSSYTVRLAQCTPGYSGADIANICNEAAIQAARLAQDSVTSADFEHSLERVTAGLERKHPTITPEEIRLSAYYVAAQALISWHLPNLTPVLKMSVSARINNPLGFVQFAPRKDLLATKEYMLDLLCRGLAGKASQVLFFNKDTDQATKDLKKISDVAYSMVMDHGMGESAPNMSFQEFRSQEPRVVNVWSDKLQYEMDAEVNAIVKAQYERAQAIVAENKELLEIISEELFKRKTLNENDVKSLVEAHGPVVESRLN